MIRVRSMLRGFRRKVSNFAWTLGGACIALIGLKPLVPEYGSIADLMGYSAIALALTSLLSVSLGGFIVRYKEVDRAHEGVRRSGDSVILDGEKPRTLRFTDIQSLRFDEKNGWLVLQNGELVSLKFFQESEARAAEALFPPELIAAPLNVVPSPPPSRESFLHAILGACALGAVDSMIGFSPAWSLPLLLVCVAALSIYKRGRRFVVARDGLRVGKRFFALHKLTAFSCTAERVSWTYEGQERSAKLNWPSELASFVERRVAALLGGEAPEDDVLERREGEDVHAWLSRIAGLFRGGDFRQPSLSKERVLDSAHGKGPLRVRVAVVAALKDEAPELLEGLAESSEDPRFLLALEAAGDEEKWRSAIESLEKAGELEA